MCIVKFLAWTYFVFALILASGQDVPELSKEALDSARKDPILVVSTASMPKNVESSEGQEEATETVSMNNDPIKPVAFEPLTTESMDINPTQSNDLSDAKLNELSTKSSEVVETSLSVTNKDSQESDVEKPLETNDVNEVGYNVSEAPSISSEYEDESKKKNPTETIVSLPEPVKVNGTSSTDTEKNKIPEQSTVTQLVTSSKLMCYSCSSEQNPSCVQRPLNEVGCSVRQGQARNGCFALVKANSNITTRGCIADLTDGNLTYCKTSKLCVLCYESGCNKLKVSSSSGLANLHSKWMLTIFGVVIVRLINCFN